MCGRYMLTASGEELALLFGLGTVASILHRYNIAPAQSAPIVLCERSSGAAFGEARWGREAHGRHGQRSRLLINARAETATVKPAFREAIARRRCLVPASGFYEWSHSPIGPPREPHLFQQKDGAPFAIAGLYEEPEGSTESSSSRERATRREARQMELFESGPAVAAPLPAGRRFVLLTTAAHGSVRAVHDRMPLILDPAQFDEWLDPLTSAELVLSHLKGTPGTPLVSAPVSSRVNSVRNDDPSLCAHRGS